MNSCILSAEVIQAPQLRYTQDNQMAIAEMVVQFPGTRSNDPPETLKVIGWGNLAQEIQKTYQEGDQVVIEGRLSMLTLDRPEGFKEKRAELTIQRIYQLGSGGLQASTGGENMPMADVTTAKPASSKPRVAEPAPVADSYTSADMNEDEIPF